MQNLTPREIEVLQLVAKGEKSARIAWKLQIKIETVKCHLTSIRDKLNAKNTLHAVVICIRDGLILD